MPQKQLQPPKNENITIKWTYTQIGILGFIMQIGAQIIKYNHRIAVKLEKNSKGKQSQSTLFYRANVPFKFYPLVWVLRFTCV